MKRTSIRQFFVLSILLTISLMSAGLASAQDTRGTIRGKVMDPNKASVPNASIKIIDKDRGRTVAATTNEDGFFQALYLTPGTYQIIVETTGFKKYVRENVQLSISQVLEVEIPLEIGTAAETVNVTVENPPLETAKSDLGLVVDTKRIAELPLVHGDPYTLMNLTPGTTYTGSARLDRPFEPTHIIGFAIDGTRGNRSDLTIDGAPSTATANGNEVIASYVPPSDIVSEFKVATATFDAQFGNTEGGSTNINIKSGTNKLHGSTYYFAEPGTWAANDYFGNARGQARPDTKSDRFGGSISGPVTIPWLYHGKDKTFFLFGYEGIRDSRPRFDAAAGSFVPTAAIAAGDFSGLGVTIYDPTTRVNTGTAQNPVYTGTAFDQNKIPTARINPVAQAILKLYAKPKGSGLVGNIFDSTLAETTQPYDNYTVRIDQNVSSKNHFFGRGSVYNRNSLYNRYTDSPYAGVNFIFASRQGVLDDVHTINSTTFINFRYGYNRFIREQDQQADAQNFDLTTLGWSSAYNNLVPENDRRFPSLTFSGGPLSNGMSNEFRPVDTHSFAIILNKTIGNHSLKFGGELRTYIENDVFQSNDQTGAFAFDNTYTKQASTTTTADVNGLQGLAAFLLGLPSGQSIVRRADYSEYSKTYGFFVQDDWKATRRLSFNLGLRYEVETPLVEKQNKSVSGFDMTYVQPGQAAARARLLANPVTGYSPDNSSSAPNIDPNSLNFIGGLLFAGKDTGNGLYKTPKNTFLPRFGFAYSLNDKTVIRGGVGLFAGFLGERRGDVNQAGFSRTTSLSTINLLGGAPIPRSITDFPNITILEPVGNSQGKQSALGTAITFFNQNPRVSKQARYQVGFQRELPWGFVAEATYVGNYGYDIEISRNINALPLSYLNGDNFRSTRMVTNNSNLTTGVANPFLGLSEFAGVGAFTGTTIARSQLLLPFPNFQGITTTNNDGKSWYNSAQVNIQKRFSQGYTIGIAYTYSKWIQQTEYLNTADVAPTKMISDVDSPHKISISGMYALPFGKGRAFFGTANGVVDRIINGWQLQGVYAYQSGFPIAFGSAGSGDLFYNGAKISLPSNERTTDRWFNTGAFASINDWPSFLPAGVTSATATAAQKTTAQGLASTAATPASHLRTLPFRFNDVRRDSINNMDLSLLKDIRIRETMKIQFRLEFTNAFNEVYMPAPAVNQTQATFGTIAPSNQDNYARRAQVGIKFLF